MSLFRRPKKPIQRRVFSSYDDDSAEGDDNKDGFVEKMDIVEAPPPPSFRSKEKKSEKKPRSDGGGDKTEKQQPKQTSLLSFGDEGTNTIHLTKSMHSNTTFMLVFA